MMTASLASRVESDQTLLKVGLVLALAGCVTAGVLSFFINGVVADDAFVRLMFPAVLLLVSVADLFTTRLGALPAQIRAAQVSIPQGDAAAFGRAAQGIGILAMMFVVSKGIYAIAAVVMTGFGWLAAPFALVGVIDYLVFNSYIKSSLDVLWRDKIQLG